MDFNGSASLFEVQIEHFDRACELLRRAPYVCVYRRHAVIF